MFYTENFNFFVSLPFIHELILTHIKTKIYTKESHPHKAIYRKNTHIQTDIHKYTQTHIDTHKHTHLLTHTQILTHTFTYTHTNKQKIIHTIKAEAHKNKQTSISYKNNKHTYIYEYKLIYIYTKTQMLIHTQARTHIQQNSYKSSHLHKQTH